MSDILEKITQSVINGDTEGVKTNVRSALEKQLTIEEIINDGLLNAMHIIGGQFERNEIYVTELLISARGVHEGMAVIKPYLIGNESDSLYKGRVVIGTVAGDLHDIGKNLLCIVLEAQGFEVIDLGVDVSTSTFIEAANRYHPDVICLSALLTTTVKSAADTIDALQDIGSKGLGFSVLVGGAALNSERATEIHADGYAPDAVSGAALVDKIIKDKRRHEQETVFGGTYTRDEIMSLQDDFYALTGVGLVFLDKKGRPFCGGESFYSCSCSGHCMETFSVDAAQSIAYGNTGIATFYRCRCGLMEISYSLMGESGAIGSLLCGHFLMEGDSFPSGLGELYPVLTPEKRDALCRYVGLLGKKMADHSEKLVNYRQLSGQQSTFENFMKRQRQLEDDLKAAELSALQNQVNPHFLFNSLNTIAHVALMSGNRDTEKLVTALARLMRYSLYQVKSTVTLEEEVHTVKDYLTIQETRFQGRITHRIDVDNEAMTAKMPCMILQPLVENACQHGLEPTKRGGIISIQGWVDNGNVFLEVTDNGVGMSWEKQKSIFNLEDIQSSKGGQVSGIGIKNVLSRLQFYFGSDCAWDISSAIDKGTTLQISFPLKK